MERFAAASAAPVPLAAACSSACIVVRSSVSRPRKKELLLPLLSRLPCAYLRATSCCTGCRGGWPPPSLSHLSVVGMLLFFGPKRAKRWSSSSAARRAASRSASLCPAARCSLFSASEVQPSDASCALVGEWGSEAAKESVVFCLKEALCGRDARSNWAAAGAGGGSATCHRLLVADGAKRCRSRCSTGADAGRASF